MAMGQGDATVLGAAGMVTRGNGVAVDGAKAELSMPVLGRCPFPMRVI